jgi:hypothetical protein
MWNHELRGLIRHVDASAIWFDLNVIVNSINR